MKTMFLKSVLSCIFSLLLTGCGLSIYEDWKASGGKAITGGGAIAGKDYINGLVPSADSRKYFSKLAISSDQPIETVSRTDDNTSKSGVRFVKNGGIVIPPGVTISFTNKGYCMDPHLPAPKAGEEFQLVPVTQLIPEDLQGTYKKLVQKASAGDESVKRNMQHLVWALRTAGTDAAYANNLTAEQKRILNRCSEYSGQFEEFNATAKANSKMIKELLAVADSYLNVKIGGVTYKASDLLDPDIGNKKINEHLNQLISMGKSLPVERSGFNYGELQPGIYTDVRGSGVLQYTAKIANSTNKEFIFYPTDYAGQVGSGTKSKGLTFFATANTSQRQRVTSGNPDEINVDDQREPEKKDEEEKEEEYEWVCKMGCKDNCKAAQEALRKELAREYAWSNLKWELSGLIEGLSIGGDWLLGKIIKTKKKGGLVDARAKNAKAAIKSYEILGYTETTIDALEGNYLTAALGIASALDVPYADDVSAVLDVAQASIDSYNESITRQKEWETYRAEQWATFWKKHEKIKKKVKSK
ncbi:MAG: hypothetical protein IJW08_03165 [Lentisphaeria bacterium]|nr:hypothetical protein [Lentisphaeria bacterium]